MPTEIWKDIAGYEGLYQASNFGRVKALKRPISYINKYGNPTNTFTKEHIMHPSNVGRGWKEHNGYLSVALQVKNKQKRYNVHRLVAQAFIPNPENKPQVNHIDGNKHNNRVDNLEWATREENMRHAAHELNALKTMYHPIPVTCVETGKVYRSMSEAARDIGICPKTLSDTLHDKKTVKGRHWRIV